MGKGSQNPKKGRTPAKLFEGVGRGEKWGRGVAELGVSGSFDSAEPSLREDSAALRMTEVREWERFSLGEGWRAKSGSLPLVGMTNFLCMPNSEEAWGEWSCARARTPVPPLIAGVLGDGQDEGMAGAAAGAAKTARVSAWSFYRHAGCSRNGDQGGRDCDL